LDMGRGLKQEYFNLTDPLVIIAAALLLANLTPLQNHRWTYAVGVALIAVHAVMSQIEPVKRLLRHDRPEVICDFYAYAARVERFPTALNRHPKAQSFSIESIRSLADARLMPAGGVRKRLL